MKAPALLVGRFSMMAPGAWICLGELAATCFSSEVSLEPCHAQTREFRMGTPRSV